MLAHLMRELFISVLRARYDLREAIFSNLVALFISGPEGPSTICLLDLHFNIC